MPKGGVYSSFETIEVQGLSPGFDLRPKGVAVRWARKKVLHSQDQIHDQIMTPFVTSSMHDPDNF